MELIENHLFSSGESAGDQEFPRGNYLKRNFTKIQRKNTFPTEKYPWTRVTNITLGTVLKMTKDLSQVLNNTLQKDFITKCVISDFLVITKKTKYRQKKYLEKYITKELHNPKLQKMLSVAPEQEMFVWTKFSLFLTHLCQDSKAEKTPV